MTTPTTPMPYRLEIQWSDEDQAYLVSVPALNGLVAQPFAHGATLVEAAREGETALTGLLQTLHEQGKELPPPPSEDLPTVRLELTVNEIGVLAEALDPRLEAPIRLPLPTMQVNLLHIGYMTGLLIRQGLQGDRPIVRDLAIKLCDAAARFGVAGGAMAELRAWAEGHK